MSASTETSPLLPGQAEPITGAASDAQLEANEQESPVAPNHQRAIKIIRIILFATSIATTVFAAIGLLMCSLGPFGDAYFSDLLGFFVFVIIVTLLVSSINLKWNVPYLVNLIADLGILFYMVAAIGPVTRDWPSDSWCSRRLDDPDGSEYWSCMTLLRTTQAVIGVSIVFAVLICVFHLELFVLRTVVFLKQRSRPRASQLSLWLPTGEITLSFTVRVLRQQTGMESPSRAAAVNIEHGSLPVGE